MKAVAYFISIVLNPFIMPFWGVLLMLKFHTLFAYIYKDYSNGILLLAFLLTIIFPLISVFVLYKSGVVSDLNLSKKEERQTPTIITLCYYFAFYYFLAKTGAMHSSILAGYLGGCIALTLTLFISPKWKISLHTLGISSLAGLFIGLTQAVQIQQSSYIIINITLLVFIGLVGSSRLILFRHTPAQVYAGVILGFIVPYLFVVNNWAL